MKNTNRSDEVKKAQSVYERMIGVFLFQKPLEDLENIIDQHFVGYGTAAHEFFQSLQDIEQMARLQADQLKVTKVKIDRKPLQEKFVSNDQGYLIIEEIHTTIVADGHQFVMRVSTLLEKVKGKWKVAHFHGSTPDTNVDVNEALPIAGLRKKNRELEEKIKARTRDLEIEAALERVRAEAMAMQTPDELTRVVDVLRAEMGKLGQQGIQASAINFYGDNQETFELWYAYRPASKKKDVVATGRATLPLKSTSLARKMKRLYLTAESERLMHPKGKALQEWYDMLIAEIPGIAKQLDAERPKSIYWYFTDFSGGSFALTSVQKPTKESMQLQRKATAVFDMAYRRFLDLKLAQAQAKEAQIEAALETVRGRTMGMQKSSELQEIANQVCNSMLAFGVQEARVTIAINFDFQKLIPEEASIWIGSPHITNLGEIVLRNFDHPTNTNIINAIRNGIEFYTEQYDKEEKDRYLKYLFKHSRMGEYPDTLKKHLLNEPAYYRSCVVWKNAGLVFQRNSIGPFSEAENQLFKRYSSVLEQAITRFLDLKKAEAQAREAQIETALERVRSRSLAMHQSAEIQEVVNTVFKEMKSLEMSMNVTSIFVLHPGKQPWEQWVAAAETDYTQFFELPKLNHPVSKDLEKAIKKGSPFYSKRYTKKQKEAWFKYAFENTDYRKILKKRKQYLLSSPWYEISFGLAKYTGIQIAKYEGETFSDDENSVLQRFTKVYEQAYVRFLDLKKAEAQAREARIEAALEKVRSASMAMHRSEELEQVVEVTFRQLQSLRLPIDGCQLITFEDQSKDLHFWSATPDMIYSSRLNIPYFDHPVFSKFWQARDRGDTITSFDLTKEETLDFYNHLYDKTNLGITITRDRWDKIQSIEHGFKTSWGIQKNTGLWIFNFTNHQFSEEENSVIDRFAKVFEQTYTRFLDLQKAERQTREAEIQLALERVRSSALAMHESDALSDTIQVLFEQMAELGVRPVNTYLVLYDLDNNQFHFRMTGKQGGSTPHEMVISFDELPQFKSARKDWESGEPVIEAAYEGDNRKDWLQLFKPINRRLPKEARLGLRDFPKGIYSTSGRHEFGSLGITHRRRATDEEKQLLVRFAYEFEVAYKRFLDLKKAEKQVREAQIETALERVRSQAMAMQRSEELGVTIEVYFEQIANLVGSKVLRCGAGLLNKENTMADITSASRNDAGDIYHVRGSVDMSGHPMTDATYKHWQKQNEYNVVLKGNEIRDYYRHVTNQVAIPENSKGDELHFCFPMFEEGSIYIVTEEALSEEELIIFRRFSSVISLTYRRFSDLKKAEEQAREAQVEAALERVRSRSMAMESGEELAGVISVVFKQLVALGFDAPACGLNLFDENDGMDMWISGFGDEIYPESFHIEYFDHPYYNHQLAAWKNGKVYDVLAFNGKLKRSYDEHTFSSPDFFDLPKEILAEFLAKSKVISCAAFMRYGMLEIISDEAISQDEANILCRFAKVFEQAYTRFLDIRKAEAQAREAEIEASLERVRAATMAMHNSEELTNVLSTLFEQYYTLGINPEYAVLTLIDLENNSINFRMTGKNGYRVGANQDVDLNLVDRWIDTTEKWKKSHPNDVNVNEYPPQLLPEIWKVYGSMLTTIPKKSRPEISDFPEGLYITEGYCRFGYVGFAHHRKPTEEEKDIVRRLAAAFGTLYQRFLDLEKAEAQAREAQIEASLERIRAKTMAMHNSNDVGITVAVLFDELRTLGLAANARCGIGIFNHDNHAMELWTASASSEKDSTLDIGSIDMDWHPLLTGARQAWAQGKQSSEYLLQGKDLKDYFKIINQAPDYSFKTNLKALPSKMYHYDFVFSEGILFAFTNDPISHEIKGIFRRFAKVFDLTYRRYLDLVKAEEQAKEAQIELSLERIRAQAMAMQKSSDLLDIVVTMRSEFVGLGHEAHYFWHMKYNADTYEKAMTSGDGSKIGMVMKLPRRIHGEIEQLKKWEVSDQPTIVFTMNVDEALDYVHKMVSWGDFTQVDPKAPTDDDIRKIGGLTYVMARTMHGEIGYSLPGMVKNQTTETIDTLTRFASTFDLAYRRFEDLLQAEAREKEAIKQSSLDRVRAEIASMRDTVDLESITPIIWKELKALGIPFFRCGIFIMDEEEQMVHAFLSTPEGKAIAALHIQFNETEVGMIGPSLEHWRKQTIFRDEWDEQQFKRATHRFMELGQIKNPNVYQAGESPPEKLVLQLVPFKQGMLYVGSKEHLEQDNLDLVAALAKAFSVAYSRYEDFVKLDLAKKDVEKTLGELRSTQTQLVHSEKMASLGELTAGIAHEIQNPLNFVNNFSDINKELLEELKEAVAQGDQDEVSAIIADLMDNETKVTHHGKRAEAIVKSMLQHSRGSEGKKEPTNINALCDEYLRLAYHGFRAKDKSFNADFKLDLDPALPIIEVVPQDIGRVLLNLINNAFQAVSAIAPEPAEGADAGSLYKPLVTVSTKLSPPSDRAIRAGSGMGREEEKIQITVTDNGPGIPDHIKDKIFQPFFTTKPTGEGTGLGLSMSYDIVTKGHGGELKVDTGLKKGSKFVIKLPHLNSTS